MIQNQLALCRLASHRIETDNVLSLPDVVSYMGAIQAQDFNMMKWAVALRSGNKTTEAAVEEAFNKGTILRTHLLRPTWHLVANDDIDWLLNLTAPFIKIAVKQRFIDWGFTEEMLHRAYAIIEKYLADGNRLTRDEMMTILSREGINTGEGRSYHLMLWAELDKIVCSGSLKNGEQTYALYDERVKKKSQIMQEEALARLARIYFTGHGPATISDFIWWSGLPATLAKKGLEAAQDALQSITVDKNKYWMAAGMQLPDKQSVVLLPAFDEFIIAYKDRSATVVSQHHSKVVSSNGVFRPTVTIDGITAGIWKIVKKKNKRQIDLHFFDDVEGKKFFFAIESAAQRLETFWNCHVEITAI